MFGQLKALDDIPIMLGHSGHSLGFDWDRNWIIQLGFSISQSLKASYELKVIPKAHLLFLKENKPKQNPPQKSIPICFVDKSSKIMKFPINGASHIMAYPYNFLIGGSLRNELLVINSSVQVFGKFPIYSGHKTKELSKSTEIPKSCVMGIGVFCDVHSSMENASVQESIELVQCGFLNDVGLGFH